MSAYDERLAALRKALYALHGDSRRLPLATYRVMVALGEAGEPCSAYAVARRACFMLEQGRVKLHEARQYGVVDNRRVEGEGVVWTLTERGRVEVDRLLEAMGGMECTKATSTPQGGCAEAGEDAQAPSPAPVPRKTPGKTARKRKRGA